MKKRILALLLSGLLSMQFCTSFAVDRTDTVSSRSISIYSNNAQSAEDISLNVPKTYLFSGYNEETDSSDYKHYYKFIPTDTDYYEVNVENFIPEETSIEIFDSTGNQLEYADWNEFTNECKTEGVKMTTGSTYFIRIYVYIQNSNESRPVQTTVTKHIHNYAVIESESATCYREGYAYYGCTKCNDSYSETLTKLDHVWETEYTIDEEPYCTSVGSKSIHCSNPNCEAVKSTVSIPATGHDYCELEAYPASCTEDGEIYYCCINCEESYTKTLPKLNHAWETKYTIDEEPDCISRGTKSIHCSNPECDEVKSTVSIPATGHDYELWEKEKASPYEDGYRWYECSRCYENNYITIAKPKTIVLSAKEYTYNGKTKTPTVTVKDRKGNTISASNYTASYTSGRKNIGKYKVTIKFKGSSYTGTLSTYFKINPKGTTLKAPTAGSKSFTAKWTKQSTQTTGYIIQYSTSSKFTNAKTVTISGTKTTSKKITKLTAKKKYYVRIRTYKTVSGTKYYSAWSSTKTVTTKK